MTYFTVFGLSYTACAVLYHSGRKRSAWSRLRASRALRGAGYAASGCLLILALMSAASGLGWERGIPLWLGLLTVAGMASLLLAITRPVFHLWSLLLMLGLCVLALAWGAAI